MSEQRVRRTGPAWVDEMPVFLSRGWLSSQSPDSGWLVDDATGAVLPYVVRRRALFRWVQLQFQPWTPGTLEVADERAVLERAVGWCRSEGFDFIAQPPTTALFRAAPDAAVSAPFGSYVLDLARDEEELWAGVHQKHRNVVRKARSDGVTVEWGPDLADEVHAMLVATMGRSGLAFADAGSFRAFVVALGEHVDVGIARLGGVAQACAVVPWSRYGAHYLYGGTGNEPAAGSANLLQWEAILRAKARGAARYDFVGARLHPESGSKYEGIQRFKQRFGATLVEGCLWKLPLSPWKYAAYKGLKRLRGDAGDIIDQEGAAR